MIGTVTTTEAARMLGASKHAVRNAARRGRLVPADPGGNGLTARWWASDLRLYALTWHRHLTGTERAVLALCAYVGRLA